MIKSLLIVNWLENRWYTSEVKALRALKLDSQKLEIWFEDGFTLKIWIMLMNNSQDALCQGDRVKIFIFKEDLV